MRFCFSIGDSGIPAHVQRIDLRTGPILALFDGDYDVVAVQCGRATMSLTSEFTGVAHAAVSHARTGPPAALLTATVAAVV